MNKELLTALVTSQQEVIAFLIGSYTQLVRKVIESAGVDCDIDAAKLEELSGKLNVTTGDLKKAVDDASAV